MIYHVVIDHFGLIVIIREQIRAVREVPVMYPFKPAEKFIYSFSCRKFPVNIGLCMTYDDTFLCSFLRSAVPSICGYVPP